MVSGCSQDIANEIREPIVGPNLNWYRIILRLFGIDARQLVAKQRGQIAAGSMEEIHRERIGCIAFEEIHSSPCIMRSDQA